MDDPSIEHDVDSVRDGQKFIPFTRRVKDPFLLLRESVNQTIDILFGSDVDTFRRFVQDEYRNIGQ